MKKLDLTILIPCATDQKIKYCIESIYKTCSYNVEILVSLNGATREIKNILKQYPKVNFCEIGEANLAKAYNNGIKNSTRSNILLMDSDCIFEKKTIKMLYDGLKLEKLSKGLVVFKYNSLISKIISKVREYTTTDFVSAFSPPLALSKDIEGNIGGYYFHEKIKWSEDSEFNYRVSNSPLKIHYNPEAVIYHVPLGVRQDIKSGFRYGMGKKISEELGLIPKSKYFSLELHMKKFIKTWQVLNRKGFFPAIYYFCIWRPVNRAGYIFEGIKSYFIDFRN